MQRDLELHPGLEAAARVPAESDRKLEIQEKSKTPLGTAIVGEALVPWSDA